MIDMVYTPILKLPIANAHIYVICGIDRDS